MDGEIQPMKAVRQIEDSLSESHWTRSVAAGSLVVSALLLISGKRKSGIAIAAAGAAVALLENPEAVRDVWNSMPKFVRASQDFLVRIEDFVEELNRQGIRLRKVLGAD
jgi:hypothetical protein